MQAHVKPEDKLDKTLVPFSIASDDETVKFNAHVLDFKETKFHSLALVDTKDATFSIDYDYVVTKLDKKTGEILAKSERLSTIGLRTANLLILQTGAVLVYGGGFTQLILDPITLKRKGSIKQDFYEAYPLGKDQLLGKTLLPSGKEKIFFLNLNADKPFLEFENKFGQYWRALGDKVIKITTDKVSIKQFPLGKRKLTSVCKLKTNGFGMFAYVDVKKIRCYREDSLITFILYTSEKQQKAYIVKVDGSQARIKQFNQVDEIVKLPHSETFLLQHLEDTKKGAGTGKWNSIAEEKTINPCPISRVDLGDNIRSFTNGIYFYQASQLICIDSVEINPSFRKEPKQADFEPKKTPLNRFSAVGEGAISSSEEKEAILEKTQVSDSTYLGP